MKILLPTFISIAFASSLMANTTTITFEDTAGILLLQNYDGFYWTGFYVVNTQTAGNYGSARNGIVSPSKAVVNFNGGAFSSQTPFNLDSAYLTSLYFNQMNVEVQGYRGSAWVYDQNYTINTSGPTRVEINFTDVTRVAFIPSGGIQDQNRGGSGEGFAMDNVTVSTPEPAATGFLLGAACIALWVFRKKFLA